MKNKKKIIMHLNESIKIKPNFSYPYVALADFYQNIGDLSLALEQINIGIKIEKLYIKEITNELNSIGNFDKISIFKKKSAQLLKCNENLSDYSLKKSKIYIKIKNMKNARLSLMESIEFNSLAAESYYLLHKIESNKKKSKKYLNIAIEIDPEYSLKH